MKPSSPLLSLPSLLSLPFSLSFHTEFNTLYLQHSPSLPTYQPTYQPTNQRIVKTAMAQHDPSAQLDPAQLSSAQLSSRQSQGKQASKPALLAVACALGARGGGGSEDAKRTEEKKAPARTGLEVQKRGTVCTVLYILYCMYVSKVSSVGERRTHLAVCRVVERTTKAQHVCVCVSTSHLICTLVSI